MNITGVLEDCPDTLHVLFHAGTGSTRTCNPSPNSPNLRTICSHYTLFLKILYRNYSSGQEAENYTASRISRSPQVPSGTSPFTECGKGKAASARRRTERSPPGMISTQRRPRLDRRGRAYHPPGMALQLKGRHKRAEK